jgi:micrococcal nuclease
LKIIYSKIKNIKLSKVVKVIIIFILFLFVLITWKENVKEEEFLVTKVIDGDTIILENGETVRYIGIDTPETSPPLTPIECFGPEATNFNKELVEGKKVKIIRDIKNEDKYGRLLRYVFINDTFINLELIKKGFARSLVVYPNVSYSKEFKNYVRKAKKEKQGLWSEQKCNGEK